MSLTVTSNYLCILPLSCGQQGNAWLGDVLWCFTEGLMLLPGLRGLHQSARNVNAAM